MPVQDKGILQEQTSRTIQDEERHLITCFVYKNEETLAFNPKQKISGGNPCLLFTLNSQSNTPPLNASTVTQCQSWPSKFKNNISINVRCYAPQLHPIQCCGHGLLAAAYYWLQRLECDALDLLMYNSVIKAWREQSFTWLRFNTIETFSCTMPTWVKELFPIKQQPQQAALAGNQDGYIILQWPENFDLGRLEQVGARLTEHTQRALICTSLQAEHNSPVVQLRYFAPQYGVDEDIATGSAVRVLAHYWSSRFSQFIALQCSDEGAFMRARIHANQVDVGGYCNSHDRNIQGYEGASG